MIDEKQVEFAACQAKMADMVVLTGVGKSGKVADLVASLWQSVGVPVQFIHATDLCHGGLNTFLRLGELNGIIVMFSHSGTTEEVVHLADYVRNRMETELWLVTSNEESGVEVDTTFVYDFERDGSIHETIPFQSLVEQVSFGARVASILADELPAEDLLSGHPGGALASAYKRELHDAE